MDETRVGASPEAVGTNWLRISGLAAAGAAVAWTVKFAILMVTDGDPGVAAGLTGGLLPTAGSVLGVLGAFGIAAPWLGGRLPTVLRVLISVVTGFVAVALVGVVANGIQSSAWISNSGSAVLRTETSALVSGLLFILVAAWVLRPSMSRRGRPDVEEDPWNSG